MRISLSPTATLFHADCRDAIRELPDNSLDSCVTDPPYHLVSIVKRFAKENPEDVEKNFAWRKTAGQSVSPYARAARGFMGKEWDGGDIAFQQEFWAEVYRVLKPGAFVAAFGASRGYHRMACAIEDAGFEIRDSLMWIYGTGFPKSHDVSKGVDRELGGERNLVSPPSVIGHQRNIGNVRPYMLDPDHKTVSNEPATPEAAEWQGWGTALKPAFEPIVLARKSLSESTVAANVLKWRTGALNIDGCRVPSEVATGWGGKGAGGNTWNESNNGLGKDGEARPVEGRWPANVVTDGSAEVVGMFPNTKSGQLLPTHNAKESDNGSMSGKNYAGRIKSEFGGDSGSAARFFYSAKASKADRAGSKHPTVKPVALMQWLARLITPPGGTILDPFAGSGTTGAAAATEGFGVVLCEREAEYVVDIKKRFNTRISIPFEAIQRELAILPVLRELKARLAAC